MAEATTPATSINVVIAIDDSEHAMDACKFYVQYQHRPSHKVFLVHSMELPYQSAQMLRAEILMDILNKAREEAAVVQNKFKDYMEKHRIQTTVLADFSNKDPGEAVVEKAREVHAGFIVMGTRGMGSLRRTILGSVSDYVIHHAHCPVMVYRK